MTYIAGILQILHRMNYRKWSLLLIAASSIVYSCNKNKLDQPALGALNASEIENKKGVEALLIGAYSMLDGMSDDPTAWGGAGSNWIYGSICGTEAHKGSNKGDQDDNMTPLEMFYATATNLRLAEKWLAVYTGVQRANEVLRILKKVKDIDDEERQLIAAEARFLRGHYHFEAVKIWKNVPYVDETVTYEADNFHLANNSSIWPQIENDFKFAMENLLAKMPNKGRANKYAAEAFLAKAYMFQSKFDSAQALLQDLIANGVTADGIPYALTNNYHDNFDPDPNKKNSSESVFAVQNSVNDQSGGAHGNLGDLLRDAARRGSCLRYNDLARMRGRTRKSAPRPRQFLRFRSGGWAARCGRERAACFVPRRTGQRGGKVDACLQELLDVSDGYLGAPTHR